MKTLISLDPDDEVPVSHLIESQLHNRPVAYVQDSVPLYDLLNEFQTGKCRFDDIIKVQLFSDHPTDYYIGLLSFKHAVYTMCM